MRGFTSERVWGSFRKVAAVGLVRPFVCLNKILLITHASIMNKEKIWKVVYYTFGFLGAWSFINLATVSLFQVDIAPSHLYTLLNPALGLVWLVVAIVAKRKLNRL